ncbi:FmdE family protein [Methanocella sp. MCL-LM]|uniref:FmdE family protein n=1 Tax=Methanocella sp. MCL-LM TaxID=3412035 RepID=UPI003C73B19A
MTQMHGDLDKAMSRCKVDEQVQENLRRCVAFHTFPAAGLLIATFMVDLALEKLGAGPGEKLYAVSETPKCAPDPLQVLLGCTTGNHRLRVINTGRFAITVNRFSEGTSADGIRVFIDAGKVKKYPTLHLWYTNDPGYKGGVTASTLQEEILCAGRDILSWEPVKVKFTPKEKWTSATCRKCGEMVPENTLEDGICGGCGSQAYYEKAG